MPYTQDIWQSSLTYPHVAVIRSRTVYGTPLPLKPVILCLLAAPTESLSEKCYDTLLTSNRVTNNCQIVQGEE